ncbi:hypothetical protein IZ6_11600 [Terrihabitans soli]|uniref:Uncharacterized protein n=1 Tax=Terrihabitans soli TaxID=708113 RepID=A0A6S6QRS0_9HYPH|nr:hypothetical protein [Terrihabitans soli]BCJ90425.1 hypothetical protein IZ6_11600 [Terrihabitans soli]
MIQRLVFLGFVLFLVDWIFFDGAIIVFRAYDLLQLIAAYLAGLLEPAVA